MSTENIDTMGFEPAVEYDVPDFGKVHVLMKEGEPWFIGRDLSKTINPDAPDNFIAFATKHKDVMERCVKLREEAAKFLCPWTKSLVYGLWIFSTSALRNIVEKTYRKPVFYPAKVAKLLSWVEDTFTKKEEALQRVVKFNDLEVVFYKGKAFVTAPSLRKASGSQHTGGMFSFGKKNNKKGLIRISNAEAIALGLTGSGSGSRILATFQRAEEYLKNVCDSSSKYIVCDWLVNTVEPAAKKHLEALKAQENAEAEAKARAAEEAKKAVAAKVEPKPTKEETPLLLNAEIVPPAVPPLAPSSLSYDELLSSWRVTMKAQEATLKELETAKKDLASRIARIDEQNADIKTLVGNNNVFQAERRKLNEEIESLKASIKDLAALHKDREDRADLVFETVRALLGLKGFDFVSDAEAVDGDSQLAVPLSEEEKHNCLLQGISNMKQYVAMQDAVIKEWTREYNILEKRLADAKAALAAKEAELSQANAKLKEAEEKAACERNNCDAILAELKAEREAKKELISKYRDTVSENDFLLKALNDRNSLKLVPPYLPPMPLHKAKEL